MNNTRKKILIISTSTKVFGAELNMLKIIDRLYHSSEYIVHTVISGWGDGLFEKKLKELGITANSKLKLGWVYKSKMLWALDSFVNYIPSYYKFYKLQKSFKPDLILTNSYQHLFLLYPFIKVPVILRVQDQISTINEGKFVIEKTKSKVSKYYAVSNFIKEDLVKCGIDEHKIKVIYNGFFVENNKSINKNISDILRIGIVGQVIPRKGHHILIKALSILKSERYNFLLKIVGSGNEEYIKRLKQMISTYDLDNIVEWKGYISDKNEIYKEIDIAVCPAVLPEPLGATAIEPSLFKIPVVTSNIVSFPEIIKEGINGFMFKNEDYLDLAKRLKYFLDNKSELDRIGNSGYEYVKNNFNIEKMIYNIKNIIDNI